MVYRPREPRARAEGSLYSIRDRLPVPLVADLRSEAKLDLAGLFPWLATWAMVFGPLTSWYARRRARMPLVWLAYGAVLGPAAGLILAAAPPGRCRTCDEPVVGWAAACPICGMRHDQPLQPWLKLAWASARALGARALVARALVAGSWRPRPSAAPDGGERPTGRSGQAPDGQAAAVATGVLVPGDHALPAEERYLLARHGELLWVLGPLRMTPDALRFERSIDRLSIGSRGATLVIAPRGSPEEPALTFRSVTCLEGPGLTDLTGEPTAPPGVGPPSGPALEPSGGPR